MPTFRHGKATAVYLNGTDMSPYLNQATTSESIDTAETTTYGAADKTYIVGLGDGTISAAGLFDSTASASDAVIRGTLAVDDNTFTVLPAGSAVGNRSIVANGMVTSYEVNSPVSDVIAISTEIQADGGLYRGVALNGLDSTGSASVTGTAVDNTASTSSGVLANLHVTSNTRNGTATFKVQHSSDNSTYVDLVTFTAVSASATKGESITSTGTVNRYLRALTTLAGSSGSVTYHISAARR